MIVAWSLGQNAVSDDVDRSGRIVFGDVPDRAADLTAIVVDQRDHREAFNGTRRWIVARRAEERRHRGGKYKLNGSQIGMVSNIKR
jgi:hypothetical protein